MMLYFLPPRSFFLVHLIITIYRRTNTQWSFIPFFFFGFELLNCSIVLGGIWIGSLVALLHGHDGLASPLPASTRLYCIHYCSIQWVCRALCFGCFFFCFILFIFCILQDINAFLFASAVRLAVQNTEHRRITYTETHTHRECFIVF